MTRTTKENRPSCPEGHLPEHVNKASRIGMRDRTNEGLLIWWCYQCRCRFWAPPGPRHGATRFEKCPDCGSAHVEREPDGTWVCWSCEWFQEGRDR